MDTAKSTTSFIRNGTLPAMAGNPPADAAQPSGMHGIIVTVPIKAAQDPSAPRMPKRLSQNPTNKSAPNSHSATPRNQLAPQIPNTGYIQASSGPWLIKGIKTCASYANHF